MISSYALTWNIFLASWQKDWDRQAKDIGKLRSLFHRIEIAPNLMWNVIMFNALSVVLLHFAEFSTEFQLFTFLWVNLPCIVGSIIFYRYKFGLDVWKLNFQNLSHWLQNWFTIQGISLTCMTQTAVIYCAGLVVEPLLPSYLQYSISFPKETHEECLPVYVCCFWGLFCVLLPTLSLWRDGYIISMKVSGRNATMSLSETLVELVYQTSQSSSAFFITTAITIILQNWGIRFHLIHFIIATVEIIVVNQVVQFKFCILHQLMHEIKPLYAMIHIEHHICKGIHPTTSAAGLWEYWAAGHNIFFMVHVMNSLPFVMFQSIYMGANIIVHTMWPSKKLLQWHTLHHTTLADIYNVNIPSPYDNQHSKTVKKHSEKLQQVSPFIRNESLSDIAAFALMGVMGLFFHYGLGIGIGHVDWTKAEWVHHYSSS